MQQCTDAQPCRLRHREPNGNRRETTRLRSDTIVDLMPDSAEPRRAERIQRLACGEGAGEDARQSAKCLPKRQGGGSATPLGAGKPKAQKSMTECTIPRRGVVQTQTHTATRPPKNNLKTTQPEHHRQDRLQPTSFRRKPESTVPNSRNPHRQIN